MFPPQICRTCSEGRINCLKFLHVKCTICLHYRPLKIALFLDSFQESLPLAWNPPSKVPSCVRWKWSCPWICQKQMRYLYLLCRRVSLSLSHIAGRAFQLKSLAVSGAYIHRQHILGVGPRTLKFSVPSLWSLGWINIPQSPLLFFHLESLASLRFILSYEKPWRNFGWQAVEAALSFKLSVPGMQSFFKAGR